MSIFSKKPTPQPIKSGIYPKRLTYDEKRKRDLAYRATRKANKPKLPAIQIASFLSLALLLTGATARMTHFLINWNGKSAIFLIFFAVILVVVFFGIAMSYVKRILNAYGVGGNIFSLIYLFVLISGVILLHQFQVVELGSIFTLPIEKLLIGLGIHFIAVLTFAVFVLWYSGNRWQPLDS